MWLWLYVTCVSLRKLFTERRNSDHFLFSGCNSLPDWSKLTWFLINKDLNNSSRLLKWLLPSIKTFCQTWGLTLSLGTAISINILITLPSVQMKILCNAQNWISPKLLLGFLIKSCCSQHLSSTKKGNEPEKKQRNWKLKT